MDESDDIEEESPCFIVLNSQSDERGHGKGYNDVSNASNGSLRELTMLRSTLRIGQESQVEVIREITNPNSTLVSETFEEGDVVVLVTKEANGNKEISCGSVNVQAIDKQHSDRDSTSDEDKSRSQREVLARSNESQQDKDPSSDSSYFPNSTSSSNNSSHTSSSTVSSNYEPSRRYTEPKLHAAKHEVSYIQQGNLFLTSTPMVDCSAVGSSKNTMHQQVSELTPLEGTSSAESFSCFQLSGDVKAKETSSSDDKVSPSFERLKPSSPMEAGNSQERPVSECLNETSLPKWQKDCIPVVNERVSSMESIDTLSRTNSNNSTVSNGTSGNEETSLHQWQSPQNGSDELFENANSNFDNEANTVEGVQAVHVPTSRGSQAKNSDCIALPEMSEDIFHCRGKGVPVNSVPENRQPPPTNDVIWLSQDDAFQLYLSQSQCSNPSLQSKPGTDAEKPPITSTNNETAASSQSILPQSSTENSCQAQDMEKHCDCANVEADGASLRDEPVQQDPENDKIVRPSSPGGQLVTFTESTELGQLPYHFLPPTDFLRPVVNTPSPCLDISSESKSDISERSPDEIETTTGFETTDHDIGSTSKFEVVVPGVAPTALSLSAPPPLDENTDEDVNSDDFDFNLRKEEFVSDSSQTKPVTKPVRSVFTNIRERFRATCVDPFAKEMQDPFEFTGEYRGPPTRMRKRTKENRNELLGKSVDENVEESACVKRKQRDDESLNGFEKYRKGNASLEDMDSEGHSQEKFWKIVKTTSIKTTIAEKEIEITYTDMKGKVLSKMSTVKPDGPPYVNKTETSEIREKVDIIPDVENLTNGSLINENSVIGNSMNETLISENSMNRNTVGQNSMNEKSTGKYATLGNHSKQKAPGNDENTTSKPMSGSDQTASSGASFKDHKTFSKRKRSWSSERQRTLRRSDKRVSHEVESLPEGSLVLAQWFDKHYYPGTVMESRETDSKYRIAFDDGDVSYIAKELVLAVDYLPRDQPVLFREEHGDCYDSGVIRGFYQKGDERGYKVVQGDGKVVKCLRSGVILDVEQAAIFLSLRWPEDKRSGERTNEHSPNRSTSSVENRPTFDRRDLRSSPRKSSAERPSKRYRDTSADERRKANETSVKMRRTSHGIISSASRPSKVQASGASRTIHDTAASKSRLSSTNRTSHDKAANISRASHDKSPSTSKTIHKATSKSRCSNDKFPTSSREAHHKGPTTSRTFADKVTVSTDDADDCVESPDDKRQAGGRASGKKPLARKSEEIRQRISTSETPKSSHKSTGKKLGGFNSRDNHGDHGDDENMGTFSGKVRRRLSVAMQNTMDKPGLVPTRTSPRKSSTRRDLQPELHLIKPTNRNLFRGYGFIITGSDVNSVQGGNEESPTEEEHPFSRVQVSSQVTLAGGVVLSNFKGDDNDDSCLLLSNSCQTTAKYFYALVVGVPCLSHVWIRDCCRENKLISYKNYLLPAGRDLITGRLVEEQKSTSALRGMKIYLVGDKDFRKQWMEVLTAAGCQIIEKLPTNVLKELQYGRQDFECDLIVVGSGEISHSTIRKAQLLGVPTVTIHWLKQCILTGERVPFTAHSSFSYKVHNEN